MEKSETRQATLKCFSDDISLKLPDWIVSIYFLTLPFVGGVDQEDQN